MARGRKRRRTHSTSSTSSSSSESSSSSDGDSSHASSQSSSDEESPSSDSSSTSSSRSTSSDSSSHHTSSLRNPVSDAASSLRRPSHGGKEFCPCNHCKGRVLQTRAAIRSHVGNRGTFDVAASQMVDILRGDSVEDQLRRHHMIASALLALVPPEHRLEARQRLRQMRPSRSRHPLGFHVPTRRRSSGVQRRRVVTYHQPMHMPFLEDHYFPRELRGRALHVVQRDFDSTLYLMPRSLRPYEHVIIWGREYYIGTSSLGPDVGVGVFASETIRVPSDDIRDRPALFPFCGPMYSAADWNLLSRQCSTYGRYGISIDLHPTCRFIDGYPQRTGNLAGYINSPSGFWVERTRPNAEWVECTGPCDELGPNISHYVMTYATRTIYAGQEIFVAYTPRRTWHYRSLM